MNFIHALRFYEIGGLRYALRDWGARDAQPLLLLHGLQDTGASFAELVTALETRRPGVYRFIAPDWRGHGASAHAGDGYWFPRYLADLDGILAAIDAPHGQVILAGHGMGGQVASLFAGLRPKRVARLITLDSLHVAQDDTRRTPQRYRRWLDAQARPPARGVDDSIDVIAARIGQRYPELDRDQRFALASQWSEPVGAHGARRLRADAWHRVPLPYGFRVAEAMAVWRQVVAPVLCIDAAESPARHEVTADAMARRRACFADLRHVVLPGCGHMLHLQQPGAVADTIRGFV